MISGGSLQWVSWIVIIAGWWFVNRTNNKRETRKEQKIIVESLRTKIEKLTLLSIEYHLSDRNLHKEWEIKRGLKYLWADINIPLQQIIDKTSLTRKLTNYKKAITYSNFDTPAHKKLEIGDNDLEGLADSSEALIRLIENAYFNCYHK